MILHTNELWWLDLNQRREARAASALPTELHHNRLGTRNAPESKYPCGCVLLKKGGYRPNNSHQSSG